MSSSVAEPQVPSCATMSFADLSKLEIGSQAKLCKRITAEDLEAFAAMSGDRNPLHMDSAFARRTSFQRRVVHGMLIGSYVSTLVGMHLPGSGALWTQQSFRWAAPVFIGDQITIIGTVKHKSEGTRTLIIEVQAVNQHGKVVMDGEGSVVLLEEQKKKEDLPVSERVALVTGGSGGTGGAIAATLAEAGAAVVITYLRNAGEAEELCRMIDSRRQRAIALRADVCDPESVKTCVERARQEFGKDVDLLINAAAAPFEPAPFLQTSWADLQALLEVQLRGAFHCAQAVLPGMASRKSGRIINIGSSFASGAPPAQWTGFAVAKSALYALTRSLAAEFGSSGICVNMVSPGMIETGSTASVSERMRKLQAMQTPLRRLATPEDVARAVLFLCSDGGSFITGADIPVCGGMRM